MTNFTMLTYRRPALTKQALDSLGDTSGMTCMIRDQVSGSECGTWDVVEEFSQKNSIKNRVVYHATNPTGTGEARNDVIRTSEQSFGRGDYLYLSDSDVFFHPGWLACLTNLYDQMWDHGFRVLGAYNHPYHQPVRTFTPRTPINGMSVVHEVQALALQSMLMRWEVWDKYGPFRETPVGRVCQGEDVDFSQAITKDGGKLGVVSPALLVNCGITNSFGEKIPGWEMVQKECPEGVVCE